MCPEPDSDLRGTAAHRSSRHLHCPYQAVGKQTSGAGARCAQPALPAADAEQWPLVFRGLALGETRTIRRGKPGEIGSLKRRLGIRYPTLERSQGTVENSWTRAGSTLRRLPSFCAAGQPLHAVTELP